MKKTSYLKFLKNLYSSLPQIQSIKFNQLHDFHYQLLIFCKNSLEYQVPFVSIKNVSVLLQAEKNQNSFSSSNMDPKLTF